MAGQPHAALVQIVTDDMPFLVTSVTAELTRQGRAIHLVIHPQLQVRRDPMGHLVEVMTDENSSFSPNGIAESWISVEIDRESPGEAAEADGTQCSAGLGGCPGCRRGRASDAQQALQATTDLQAHPPAGMEQADVEEALRYLDWLSDERFTFLGYTEYRRPPDSALDGNGKLAPCPTVAWVCCDKSRRRPAGPLIAPRSNQATLRRSPSQNPASARCTGPLPRRHRRRHLRCSGPAHR